MSLGPLCSLSLCSVQRGSETEPQQRSSSLHPSSVPPRGHCIWVKGFRQMCIYCWVSLCPLTQISASRLLGIRVPLIWESAAGQQAQQLNESHILSDWRVWAGRHLTVTLYWDPTCSVFFSWEFFQVEKWVHLQHGCKMCTRWWFLEERSKGTSVGFRGPGPALQSGDVSGIVPIPSSPHPTWHYSLGETYECILCISGPYVYEKNLKMKLTAWNWGSWRTLI